MKEQSDDAVFTERLIGPHFVPQSLSGALKIRRVHPEVALCEPSIHAHQTLPQN